MSQAAPVLGKFVSGSTMRHVVTMTATGSVGLVAVFAVDALNLFYISLLKQSALTAAVGYASTLLFFATSLGIGLSIATGAMTSRVLGRGDRATARELAGASLVITAGMMLLLTLLLYPLTTPLLALLGATGETARLAARFMYIVLPSLPLLGLGMCLAALLRSVGDAQRAMYVTLSAAAATVVLDPLLIFGFGWGLDGAAIANVLARLMLVVVGLYGLIKIHNLLAMPDIAQVKQTLVPFLQIGFPAILTQIATPVGNGFVTAAIAAYGDEAVAAWAVIGRLIPVAFGVLFALSGAVGPIIGQNFGAGRFDRVRQTVIDSLQLTVGYVLLVWLLMALSADWIAQLFAVTGLGYELVVFFCVFVAGSFLFNGMLFVANAAFNNLGYAFYSTLLNWGRSTLGVAPFVWLGGHWYGAEGVLAGYGLGVIFFGLASCWLCFRVLDRSP